MTPSTALASPVVPRLMANSDLVSVCDMNYERIMETVRRRAVARRRMARPAMVPVVTKPVEQPVLQLAHHAGSRVRMRLLPGEAVSINLPVLMALPPLAAPKHDGERHYLSRSELADAACFWGGVERHQLAGQCTGSRTPRLALPRQMFFSLAYRWGGWRGGGGPESDKPQGPFSLTQLGRWLGGADAPFDHTTVLHGVRRIARLRAERHAARNAAMGWVYVKNDERGGE